MMVTEDQKTEAFPAATMEPADDAKDTLIYSNVPSTRYAVSNITAPAYPVDNSYSNPNSYVAKVKGDGNKIGPSIVLKVMSGDHFNVRVGSWYANSSGTYSSPNPLNELVSAMATAIGGLPGAKAGASQLSSSSSFSNQIGNFLSNEPYDNTKPKAYLNWILLDEQFNYVASSSGQDQVKAANAASIYYHQFNNLQVNKNGYLYVYVSNQTPNQDVFFDNLQVTLIHGPVLEENHYYPFGLTMQGISSKALNFGDPANKRNKFQNQEYDDELGIDLYEFKYREDDPQIGRFWQIDPLSNKYEYNSTYAFSENHVTSHVELEGLEKASINEKKSYVHVDPKLLRDVADQTQQGSAGRPVMPVTHFRSHIDRGGYVFSSEAGHGDGDGPPATHPDGGGYINIDGILDNASMLDRAGPIESPESAGEALTKTGLNLIDVSKKDEPKENHEGTNSDNSASEKGQKSSEQGGLTHNDSALITTVGKTYYNRFLKGNSKVVSKDGRAEIYLKPVKDTFPKKQIQN